MKLSIKTIIKFCIFLVCTSKLLASCAVTYEQSPGRFGDNLLSYIHAKWIAYKYNLPLLYKPFKYSDKLVLHTQETILTSELKKKFKKIVRIKSENQIDPHAHDVPYEIPYFPESEWEREHCTGFDGKKWPFIAVDWNNKQFIEHLRASVKPAIAIPELQLPKDRLTIALHMRRGGNHDTQDVINYFPLKFLPDEFYVDQIKKISAMSGNKPLYVYLFTDDLNPIKIMKKIQRACCGLDIEFACRNSSNSDTTNVVEDFFALAQFDCLIRSESNYSFVMGKLCDYDVEIYPIGFEQKGKKIIYTTNITV